MDATVQILPMDQTAGAKGRKILDVEKPYCVPAAALATRCEMPGTMFSAI
jgi:hypothetical protein